MSINTECINFNKVIASFRIKKNNNKLFLDFSYPALNAALNCCKLQLQFHRDKFDIEQQKNGTGFLKLLLNNYLIII